MTPDRLIVEADWAALPGGVRTDVAILIDDGRIRTIESRAELAAADGERVDGAGMLALPGLVNAHQHGQPDPKPSLGVADAPLECWLVSLLAARGGDPYSETRRLCPQLARSGATTAVHFHYRAAASAAAYETELRAILRGYRDGGVRGIVACDVRDRGQPVYGDTALFVAGLPAHLAATVERLVRPGPSVDEMLDVVVTLHDEAQRGLLGDVGVVIGPPGPPWCSEELWGAVAAVSADRHIPVHTHLLETWYEREFGRRDGSGGSVAMLKRLGMLCPRLFVAHGVWLDETERDQLAAGGVSVVTNPSSNLRLHAGIAPIPALLAAGVNVALGTDNLALSERDDLLGEIRLLRALHRQPGIDQQGLDAHTCLRVASENGGRAIGRDDIGRLRVGGVGDVVLVRIDHLRRSSSADPLELAVGCATPDDVAVVIAGGRRLDLSAPPAPAVTTTDAALRDAATALLPFVRSHYRAWHRPTDADGAPLGSRHQRQSG